MRPKPYSLDAYCSTCREDHGKPNWADVADAAEALGLSKTTVYDWVNDRKVRIGEGSVFFGSNGKYLIDFGCKLPRLRLERHKQKQQRGKRQMQATKALKIGIISKKDYAKSHADALRQEGHKVQILGGDTTVRIPPSLDVLICRNTSCSHGASDKAYQISRKGETPVIFEDSVTKIVAAVKKLIEPKGAQPNMSHSQPTTRELLADLLRTTGILYPSLLQEKKPSHIAAFTREHLGLPGETGRIAGLMRRLQDRHVGTVAKANRDLLGTGTFPTTVLWRVNHKNRSFPVSVLTTIPLTQPLIDTLCGWGNFTREQAPGSTAITGKFGHPSLSKRSTGDTALTKPIQGTYYRAYCHKQSGRWSVRRKGDTKGREHFGSHDRDEVIAKIEELDAAFTGAESQGPSAQYLVVRGAMPTSRLDRMEARIKDILAGDIPWADDLTEARELSDLHYETIRNAPKRKFPLRRVDGLLQIGRSFEPKKKNQRISVTPALPEWFEWLAPKDYVSTKALRSDRPDRREPALKPMPVKVEPPQPKSKARRGQPAPGKVKSAEKIITKHYRAYPRNAVSQIEGGWRWAIHTKGKYDSSFTGTVDAMNAHLAELNNKAIELPPKPKAVEPLPPEAGTLLPTQKLEKPEKPEKIVSQFFAAYAKTWQSADIWRWDIHENDGGYSSFVGSRGGASDELARRDAVVRVAKVAVAPAPAPAPAPVQNGAPPVAAAAAAAAAPPSAMDTLTDLLRQLQIQMRVLNLTEISLSEEGDVNFKRKKIVTIIEDGTLSL